MIISKNYGGVNCVLVYDNGLIAKKGDHCMIHGDPVILRGGRAPHKPSSQGKVWVSLKEGDASMEYYSSVINTSWVDISLIPEVKHKE